MWIVPLALLVIGGIIFLLLSGAPYGRDESQPIEQRPATETIAEGESEATATLVEAGDTAANPNIPPPNIDTAPPGTATTTPPPTATVAPPILREDPPPAVTQPPRTVTRPPTVTQPPRTREIAPPAPVSPPARPSGEISGEEAVNILRGYITSNDYYGIGARCTSIRGATYRNVGYTIQVHDSCSDRMLGLWRVDSKTREIFRQQGDGRFLRP